MWRRPILLVALTLAGLTVSRAGGQMTFGDDTNTSANDGPPFFGFVRDADGAAVGDARVTATVKSGGAVVTTSNSIGVYKVAGFAKSINPDDIDISCAKDGYKQDQCHASSECARRHDGPDRSRLCLAERLAHDAGALRCRRNRVVLRLHPGSTCRLGRR